MLLENQRKDETGRILAARRFQARSTGLILEERAVKTKPPGPSCENGPGGVSFEGFENLAFDQAMPFWPESGPGASDVTPSALPWGAEPLPLPFWLKTGSTRPAVLDETPWAGAAGLYITVSVLA